ncbi:radical SAM protein [bacterium]|nr:radical SAM protein [bacterium]
MGLRFLKINIPGIDILEYPTWQQFKDKLSSHKYDILGFSFYINEIPKIIRMIEHAREAGIKEIWGGNYGVLTPGLENHFDRIFVGYAEKQVAEHLGYKIERIKHPTAVTYLAFTPGLQVMKFGILHTSRGCTLNCRFCQTPRFCDSVQPISIKSIEEVLLEYKKLGVNEIQIMDENFGILEEHAEEVVSVLDEYGFYWYPMIRAKKIKNKLDEWYDKGVTGAFIGIENLHQKNLNYVSKGESVKTITRATKALNKKNMFIVGYYIVGFSPETKQSIKADMKRIEALKLDLSQICVLTPLPRTKLEYDISRKFGMNTNDYSLYDLKHLVWNHPKIKSDEMNDLLDDCFKLLYSNKTFFTHQWKALKRYADRQGVLKAILYLIKSIFEANLSLYIKKDYKKLSAK